MTACTFGGISVELGEQQREVESIPGAVELFRAHKLPMNARLLGYRYFHESTTAPEHIAGKVIQRTLAATGVDPAEIDRVIFASADIGFMTDRLWLPRLMERHGLHGALPLTMTGQECTSLLSAIDMARSHVQEGACRRVLVVSYDCAKNEAQRVQPFGVVSDAASACLVSAVEQLEFGIRGYVHHADMRRVVAGDDLDNRKALIHTVTNDLLSRTGVSLDAITCVFSTNFFAPLAAFNAGTLGVGKARVRADSEQGHCLCVDPLLNVAKFMHSDQEGRRGDLHLLQAHAPGFLATMLIERMADATPSVAEPAAELVVESW